MLNFIGANNVTLNEQDVTYKLNNGCNRVM